jgi:hypothetical protein
MANQEELVRSSMRNLIQKEKESNMFRKKLQTTLKIPMSMDMKQRYSQAGIHMGNGDLSDAITASLVLTALGGGPAGISAYAMIRDTMGYKPIEQVKNDVIVRIDMSPKAKELGE